MASGQVLFLLIPRAEAENPKPRSVGFWRDVKRGLHFQAENGATMLRPFHSGLMAPIGTYVVSDQVLEV